MKRTPRPQIRENPLIVSTDQPRVLAEEVRRQFLQMRGSTPDCTGHQVFRDALVFTARIHGLTAEGIEASLTAWSAEITANSTSGCYDAALAAWLQGDMELAAEKAKQATVDASRHARSAAATAEKLSEAFYAKPGATAIDATPAGQALSDARLAAANERRAWLLLAQIEYGGGRLQEALRASRSAMAAAMVEGDPLIWVEAASQVAWILDETGQRADAEPLLRSILRVLEQTLGPAAPEVAAALNNLAGLLRSAGHLDESEMLYRRALSVAEKAFGASHPQVAICLNNLAAVLRERNRPADAEPLLRRAWNIDEEIYGADHPSVALYLNNLASLLHGMHRHEEALPLFQRALQIDERLFGDDHPSVAGDLDNLAVVLRNMNRHSEAEPLLRRSLELAERQHGPDDHHVAQKLTHLSMLLCDMGRAREAGDLSRRAVKSTLCFAARRGMPAPGTRLVGQAYCQLLRRLDIPNEEMPAMLYMMKSEVEHEVSGSLSHGKPFWLEAVMDEMGIAYDRSAEAREECILPSPCGENT